ncbi:type IV secretion system protein [Lysobacter sp. ESA13C]|uniref:type IV secretion system protein n=1 Tax=Lysobacter sp. ESA13C TaxID=2862676 RepID=UPI001CBB19DE|nr:type IV secretion system protein [Lysobacter sp. ESA13C]
MIKGFNLSGGWLPNSSPLDWLNLRIDSVGDFVFFRLILTYLRREIQKFGLDLMGNAMQWVGGIALTLMTLWILLQGYRIVTGMSREPMMALVTNSLRATFIVAIATSMGVFGTDLHEFLTDDVKKEINWVVTGDQNSTPEQQIDKNLGWMQLAWSSIDAMQIVSDPALTDEKTRAMWAVGFGTGGPAITAGISLLLYEIAMALFIGLGPIFILCLLFDQTKQLFSKWLYYGIGTMFSMAMLSAMVAIAMEMVAKVAAVFWGTAIAGAILGSQFTSGMSSQALQQGGLGLILTVLIISAPPMAAMFFQGVLGQFSSYNQFQGQTGQSGSPGAGIPPHYSGGGQPPQRAAESQGSQYHSQMQSQAAAPRFSGQQANAEPSPGQRGLAGSKE